MAHRKARQPFASPPRLVAALAALLVLGGSRADSASILQGFLRGDADLDGALAITDAVLVLNHLFTGGAAPACEDPADSNDDGVLDLTDPIRALEHLFLGAPALPPPGPLEPGYDTTPDLFPCGGGPAGATLDADQVFERLTSTSWVWTLGGDPPLSEHFAFRRDGAFGRCAYSEFPLGSASGRWDFQKTTSAGGTLRLSTGDFLRFFFRDDGALVIVDRVFAPGPYSGIFCDPPPPESCSGCGRGDLQAVPPPSLISELSGRTWRKTDDLDLHEAATTIAFAESGRYTAHFRNGACSFGGFWSAPGGGTRVTRDHDVILESPRPGCDFRDGAMSGSLFTGREVELRDGLLRLDDDTYAEAPSLLEAVFRRTGRKVDVSSVEVEGRYMRALRRGRNACRLVIRNVGENTIPAGSVRVSRQALFRLDGSHVEAEDELVLDELHLLPIDPGASFELEIDLDATGTRTPEVRFELDLRPVPLSRPSFIASF